MNKMIVALLAGVAIGVLIAPDKGSETVKKIRKRVNDLTDKAEDCVNDLANKGKNIFKGAQDRFENALD